MNFRRTGFALLKIACVIFYLTGCGGSGVDTNPPGCASLSSLDVVAIGVTPQPVSIPVGQSVTFTANAGPLPMSGPVVTITMISQADPTKTATSTITLH